MLDRLWDKMRDEKQSAMSLRATRRTPEGISFVQLRLDVAMNQDDLPHLPGDEEMPICKES
jgi:hypothetical protein